MSSSPEEKAAAAETLADQIGPELQKLKPAYLCSKCHATNPAAAADHATMEECLKAWQTLAAQSLAAIEVGKRKIAAHQKLRHLGFRVTNPELNLCTRCLITGFSAYQHLAGYFGTFPKNGAKGGLVDVGPRIPLVPRAPMRAPNRKAKVPLLPSLGDAPGGATGGPGGDVAPGNLLQDPPPGPGVD